MIETYGWMLMVYTARQAGATSTFAGSGGAIVGTYKDDDMFARLTSELERLGVAVIKPKIVG